MSAHLLANLKAYVALVGSIASALLGVFAADSTVGKVLTVVAVIATAVGTWAVSNVPASGDAEIKPTVFNAGH